MESFAGGRSLLQKGTRMKPEDHRDLQIGIQRSLGHSEEAVAENHGVSTRTVRRVYKKLRDDAHRPDASDPVGLITEEVMRLDSLAEDLAKERIWGRSSDVRIRAMLGQLRVWKTRRGVLTDIGVFPSADYQSIRRGCATQIEGWLRTEIGAAGYPNELGVWISKRIQDWVDDGPKTPHSEKWDIFGRESVRSEDAN